MSIENVGKRCRWGRVRVGIVGRDPQPYEEHEGTIAAFVPSGASLRQAELECAARYPDERRAADAIDEADGIPRYLVRVDRESARGATLRPHWYAPRASKVEVLP